MVALLTLICGAYAADPALSASFDLDTIAVGGVSELTFQLEADSPNMDVAFDATLPVGVTLASTTWDTDCDALIELTEPQTIDFTEGRVGTNCFLTVWVRSDTPGSHVLVSSDLTTSAGTFGGATATLTVDAGLQTWSATMSPAAVPLGEPSTLTYVLDPGLNLDDPEFTVFLPSNLDVAEPPNFATDCPGAVWHEDTQNVLDFDVGGALDLTTIGCSASVDVLPVFAGTYDIVSNDLNYDGTNAGPVATQLLVSADPLRAIFTDDPVSPGDDVTLELSLTNFDRFTDASDIGLTVDLGTLLTGLAASSLPTDPCGAGSTLTGTDVLTLEGASLPAEGSCTIPLTLSVPSSALGGTYTHQTSVVDLTHAGSADTWAAADMTLVVTTAPVVTMAVTGSPAGPGDSIDITYRIDNPDASEDFDQGTLEHFLLDLGEISASSLPANDACGTGSTFGFVAFTDPPRFSGNDLSVPAAGFCEFTVTYDLPGDLPEGLYALQTERITGVQASVPVTGGKATGELAIVAAPVLEAGFEPASAAPGGVVDLVFRLSVGESSPTVTDIAFDLDLDAMMTGLVATGLPLSDACGTGSTVSGTDTISLSGGALDAALPACTFTVPVQLPGAVATDVYTGQTSNVTAMSGGEALVSQGVPVELSVGGLDVTASFTPAEANPGDTVTITYVLTNLDAVETAAPVLFADDLGDATFPGSTAVGIPLSEPCGPGSSMTPGPGGSFTVTTPALAPSAQCTFDLMVALPTDLAAGEYEHTTGSYTGFYGSGAFSGPSAVAPLLVSDPLAWIGVYLSDAHPGQVAPLQITIDNNHVTDTASSIGFTLDLDSAFAGMVAEGLPLVNVCGTGSSIDGTGVVTLVDGALPSGTSCTIDLDVRVPSNAVGPATIDTPTSDLSATYSAGTEIVAPLDLFIIVPNTCPAGFEGFNDECIDIDECDRGLDNCSPVAVCTNVDFSFECACSAGYTGDGVTCDNIDECDLGTDDCHANADCTDNDGGWTCTCEEGYQGTGVTCDPVCGDAFLLPIEGCDDGNNAPGDGCDPFCEAEPGYVCGLTCIPICGDSQLIGGETCDDGQSTPTDGDGCDSQCMVEDGWECDDQLPSNCDTVCGDGLVRGTEECDDANDDAGDGSDACTLESGFSCDGEPSQCAEICSNGELDPGEDCDDGNLDVNDGCDDVCKVEAGYSCAGEPSECAPNCGDGELDDALEECDDGNNDDGDGCAADCTREVGFECDRDGCTVVCDEGETLDDDGNCVAPAIQEEKGGCNCATGPDPRGLLVLLPILPLLRRR